MYHVTRTDERNMGEMRERDDGTKRIKDVNEGNEGRRHKINYSPFEYQRAFFH
jgi:hypothetical protein